MRLKACLPACLCLSGLALLAAPAARAQTAPPTGIPPFSTVQQLPEGALNLGDLNLHVAIPIVNKAGRGLPLTYTLGFDSDIWAPVTNGKWTPSPTWGWTGETDAATGYILYSAQSNECAYGQYPDLQYYEWTTYSGFEYVDTSGQVHGFNNGYLMEPPSPPSGVPCGPSGPASYSGSDGQFTLSANETGGLSFSVLSPGGTLFNPPAYPYGSHIADGAGSLTGPNGNSLSFTGTTYTDTLGVAELAISGAGTPASPITYALAGGGSDSVHFAPESIATGFSCPNVAEFSGSADLPSSIILADGASYSFEYGGDGRLASVTLPTGAAITYAYSGINCADGSPATLTRTVNGKTWTYAHSVSSAGGVATTDVTDPEGNETDYSFYNNFETQRVVHQGTSTVLETVYTCYNGSNCTASGGNGGFTLPITSRAVITELANGQEEEETLTDYDGYGDPTEVDQYDWASGTPTAILRKTLITYANLSGIADRPKEIAIEDGGGNLAAETQFDYDQTTPQATNGLPQHGAPPEGSRGNLTAVQKCTAFSGSSCANWLTTTISYYDTGEIYQIAAPGGAVTTYQYAAGSPGCAGAFPTNITNALGHPVTAAWDCNGGVLASATGLNGHTTDYSYADPLWRLTGVSNPDGGGETISYLSPTETETSTKISSNLSKVQYALLDSLGRPAFTQTVDGSSCDTVQTTYDADGRPYQVSQPYSTACGAPSGGAYFTATAYDALGRPTTVTAPDGGNITYAYPVPATVITGPTGVKRVLATNGLGGLTAVCEVTALAGSGACGLGPGQSGYLTTYQSNALGEITQVTEDAQPNGTPQSRTFAFDGLGRLTAETTPESGTTEFYFGVPPSGSPCAASIGNLVERVDAMGNVTCFGYDALSRLTSVTYPSGPYASATPPKIFIYDSAKVDGQAMTNALGRLAEAYTGASGAKITDEGFGYDAMGRPTEFFESTPNSGGYYATQESYWLDGQEDTLQLPWTPLITYNPNARGEIISVAASSGQNPASAVQYNTAGQVTAITFGSGDGDGYEYDPETGRMSQYQFTVNGQTDTGNLTGNKDGTLAALDIADNISGSGDTENCTYAHDDLGRLSGVNCGSLWQQTFSLDAFGNLAKSGSLNWAANYPSGNHASLDAYDGDGNVTSDGTNTYAWDAAGQMIALNTNQAIYDALGRLAQESANNNLRFYYSPDGARAGRDNACCGIRDQFVWLPGGGMADYDCCSVYYYEHPGWLGSWRLASDASRNLFSAQALAPFAATYAHTGPALSESFTGQDFPLTLNAGGAWVFTFPFRQYSPTQGRWLSPDPAGLAAVNPANPQTWNAYAYVADQPLEFTDSLGLAPGDCIGDCGQAPPGGYYFHDGQLYYGDSPVSASPWDMLDPSFWDFTVGNYPPVLQQPTGQNGGGHISPETVPISTGLSLRPAAPLNACTQPILNAVNNQFGTDFTAGNLEAGQPPFQNGGATNVNILGTGLPPVEFNAIQTGRYPVHWWTLVTGVGPTLHVTGRTWLDPPPAVFQNSNVGGATLVLFTAHIDSSFAYNPIGAIIHLLEDVLHLGGPRNPCP